MAGGLGASARRSMVRGRQDMAIGAFLPAARSPQLFKFVSLSAQEAEDVLDRVHVRPGYGARPLSPLAQDLVGKGRIGRKAQHFGADRSELGYRQVGERGLERRELGAAEALERVGLRLVVQGGEDADEIVGFGARLEPLDLARQRLR